MPVNPVLQPECDTNPYTGRPNYRSSAYHIRVYQASKTRKFWRNSTSKSNRSTKSSAIPATIYVARTRQTDDKKSWSNLHLTFCQPTSRSNSTNHSVRIRCNTRFMPRNRSTIFCCHLLKVVFYPVEQPRILRKRRSEYDNCSNWEKNTHRSTSEVSRVTKPTGKKLIPSGKIGKPWQLPAPSITMETLQPSFGISVGHM